ncbi:hypothetical protein A152_0016465 [Vibrio tasmaniensis 1F-187]|uniref:Uncharacterized protein n=1 Tax=Vibrio tasmaniensis TaxID=212663 RepID=A0A0H3ZQ27_9VIBR|nr:hypothetical protein [Vibrio tasmaniensis]AKN36542.1 hypothetical protein [Vibrio tasmaniensis]
MDYKINDPVVLEMLVDTDWRVLHLTYRQAIRLLRRTHHRGYLLYREGQQWDAKT